MLIKLLKCSDIKQIVTINLSTKAHVYKETTKPSNNRP